MSDTTTTTEAPKFPVYQRGSLKVIVLEKTGKGGKFTRYQHLDTGKISRVKTAHFNRKPLVIGGKTVSTKTGFTRARKSAPMI